VKVYRICVAILLTSSALSACGTVRVTDQSLVTGSGHVVSRGIPITSFSKLEVSSAFVTTISLGSSTEATVRVDDNLVDDLDVYVSGDTLHVGLDEGVSVRKATLEADLATRSLVAIEGNGAAKITLGDALAGDGFAVELSGAATLAGEIEIEDGTAELSGASKADLTGEASALRVVLSGASQLSGRDLTVGDLTIELSGASDAELAVTGSISAAATGASTLRYAGSPTVTQQEVSGGSQISPTS